jgi:hypothetical protein
MAAPFWTRTVTLGRLAKALFATDPRVKAFAERVAERPENLQKVLREMWKRNEGGWMAEALKRVRDMDQLLIDAQKDRVSPKGSRPARAATCTPRKT